MEILLIDDTDFLPYRAITQNVDKVSRLQPHIVEAQTIELNQLLGDELYFKLLQEIEATNYFIKLADLSAQKKLLIELPVGATPEQIQAAQTAVNTAQAAFDLAIENDFVKLLIGENYINEDDVKIYYSGLKPVLVYLTYMRFVNRDNIRSTPSGFVVKTTIESQPISGKQIAEEAQRAHADAMVFFRKAEKYMKDKSSVFKKYRSGCCDSSAGTSNSQTRLSAPRGRGSLRYYRKNNDRHCR